ncbi:hypothetical protein [Shumkonia mesophila]|uniref:hypothetical protein n=1 Tax=Shumkonia mesophila TaxID=2838854 RepID=UPI002934551D|nr:hypothetical protein [Shumkonia mesophila]
MSEDLVHVEIGMEFDPDTSRWGVYEAVDGACQHLSADEARRIAGQLCGTDAEPSFISALLSAADQADAANRPRN